MLLENESIRNKQPFNNLHTKIDFSGNQRENEEISNVGRIRTQHHRTVRIREIQKIKAQKRKALQIAQSIEQILQSSFPKESQDAKIWALNLAELFKSSMQFQIDPFKLREIYLLAEKFPNLGTLTLFYLSLQKNTCQNILTLFDLDIWKFLHNILKFPQVKNRQNDSGEYKSEVWSCSPASKNNLNIHFVEINLIKVAIETFICLFTKCISFRNFSIENHQTFSNYLKPTYKKYRQSIKTEVILFLKFTFAYPFKVYSKQILQIFNFTHQILIEYMEKMRQFKKVGEWDENQMKQTIQEATKRSSYIMDVMNRIMDISDAKWVKDLIVGMDLKHDFDYLSVINQYLEFGQQILIHLCTNPQNLQHNHAIFCNSIQLFHNTFVFYQSYVEKVMTDMKLNQSLIHIITQKGTWMLHFLKRCEQNKLFINGDKCLIYDVEKTKQACLFVIDNAIGSDFATYKEFERNFIFMTGKSSEEINLLQCLSYLFETQHVQKVVFELIQVVFSLLKMDVPNQEVNRFGILRELLQKLCEMICDEMVHQNNKIHISINLLLMFVDSRQKLGEFLNFKEILSRNVYKLEQFMCRNRCSEQLFKNLEMVVKSSNGQLEI